MFFILFIDLFHPFPGNMRQTRIKTGFAYRPRTRKWSSGTRPSKATIILR